MLLAEDDGQLDASLAHAREATRLRPDSANYHDTLASVHLRRGEFLPALVAAKRATELDPDDQDIRQTLNRALATGPVAP